MGKSLPSMTRLQELTRIVSSDRFRRPKRTKPISQIPASSPKTALSDRLRGESDLLKLKMESNEGQSRVPLARVVSDCVNRWFQDTLKEAKAGDSAMQVLVGQMYYSGYGVPRDPQKGRAWMSKASKSRNSVWNVSDKHPGYNASDSDSDERKDDVIPA